MIKLYPETITDNETNRLIMFEPLPLEPHQMEDECYYFGYTVTTFELEKEPVTSEPPIMLMVYRTDNPTMKVKQKTIVWLTYLEIKQMYEDPLKFYKKHFDENNHLIR